ncbi:hypothetical protein PN499_14230 [Kamptonema animale CS-326]|nr:hypothetical protein [Kamptonema animale]MDB9512346.1 hypothetical protein [Kamptonema animale CS-326]
MFLSEDISGRYYLELSMGGDRIVIVRWALAATIFFYELQVFCGDRPPYV